MEFKTDYFPLLECEDFLPKQFYEQLKSTFPNFNNYQYSSNGQQFRYNVCVIKNNINHQLLKQHNPEFATLFDYLCSNEFKRKIFTKFTPQLMKENGFIGNLKDYQVEMQICQSGSNYENPWHVDTRKRIVHGLLYFGQDTIQEGGEIAIAKHKKMKLEEYPQYPKIDNLEEITKFKPKDNFSIFILSTPNSYHKGCKLKGLRRFLYIGFNYLKGNAWKCKPDWNQRKPFHIELANQTNSS